MQGRPSVQELRASVSFYLNNPTPSSVPQVLKTCAEFIEEHGVVDGIYRLSGVTSNIQRLRYTCSTAESNLLHT